MVTFGKHRSSYFTAPDASLSYQHLAVVLDLVYRQNKNSSRSSSKAHFDSTSAWLPKCWTVPTTVRISGWNYSSHVKRYLGTGCNTYFLSVVWRLQKWFHVILTTPRTFWWVGRSRRLHAGAQQCSGVTAVRQALLNVSIACTWPR